MHIGLQTWGSDGDILPFFSLAHGLNRAGHTCLLAYTSIDGKDYTPLGAQLGVDSLSVPLASIPEVNPYNLSASTRNDRQLKALLDAFYEPSYEAMLNTALHLGRDCDLLIGHLLCHSLHVAAEIYKRPRAVVTFSPQSIADPAQSPLGFSLGPWFNRAIWAIGDQVLTRSLYAKGHEARQKMGLQKLKSIVDQLWLGDVTMVAASQILVDAKPKWPAQVAVTGHFEMANDKHLFFEPSISDFINDGTAPVLFAFGTCMGYNSPENFELLAQAAQEANIRAIIQVPEHQSPQRESENIMVVGKLPHAQVMPLCKAVVHHGGAGTLHATLASGVPSVVVPHAYDQLFWADVVARKGFGINAGVRKNLKAAELAKAIRSVFCNPQLAQNCTSAAAIMSHESGIKTAIQHLEKLKRTKG